jgi:hypothetical protein
MNVITHVPSRRILTGVIALTIATAIMLPQQAIAATPATDVVTLHTDHPTYQGLNNLSGGSETVIRGTVLGAQAGDTIPFPDDPTGPRTPIPQTDYTVRVEQTHKGTVRVGQTIKVVLAGGLSGSQQFEQEGVPVLTANTQYVFFLLNGDDTKFYPLAGGSAVATKNADGSFTLSAETTGSDPLSFTQAQLSKVPAPDHVTLTLLGAPPARLDGNLQSGSLAIARSRGLPISISGTALVAGHVVTASITIDRWKSKGAFGVDGTEYTLTAAFSAPGPSNSVAVFGIATSNGKTYLLSLQVFDR